jgi:hypothetical protein
MSDTRSRSQYKSATADVSSSSNIQSSFQTAKSASITLPLTGGPSEAVTVQPNYLVVQGSQIGDATTLTIAISTDSGGDAIIIPDTEATLALGKTTTTDCMAGYAIDLPYVDISGTAVTLYVHFKADAGNTLDIDSCILYYTEGVR